MTQQFRIQVIVDPREAKKGTRVVRKELEETEGSADKLGKTIRRALAFVGAAALIRELGRLSEAYNVVENRLRAVTSSQQEATAASEALFEIANRTRQSYEATAETFARVALSAAELGRTQEELLQFTESLNQAVTLSGSSAQEASAGLIQLSQGLASGALRGDELRSVLEQLPAVADIIARSLGVTRGELRELGQEGKITADIVLQAFEDAREELDERFAKTVPTVGQAFTVLRNNVLQFVGETDNATGASTALASTLIFLGENVELFAATLLVVAVSTIPALVAGIQAAIASSTALSGVFAAGLFNPVILGAAAAGAATLLLVDAFVDVNEKARETKAELDAFLRTDDELLTETIRNVSETLAEVNAAVESGAVTYDEVADNVEALTARLEELGAEQEAVASGASLNVIRAQREERQRLASAVDDVVAAIEEENELLQLNSREREIQATLLKEIADLEKRSAENVTDDDRADIEAALRRNQALADQASVLERLRGPAEELERNLAALNALQEAGRISAEEYARGLAELGEESEGVELPGGVDVSGIQAAIAAAQEQARAAREQALADRERAAVLAEIQGPLAELEARERVLQELRSSGAITAEQFAAANERNAEAIRLLNPEYALQQQILEELNGPLEQARARLDAVTELYTSGQITLQQYTEQWRELDAVLNPLTEVQQREAEILEELNGRQADQTLTQEALNNLLATGAINAEQYAAALERAGIATERTNSASAGLERGLERGVQRITDVESAAERLAVNGFAAAEDALVSFVRTGEVDFQAFVDSLLDDIARLLVRQALLAAFGGGGGAAAGAVGGLFTAADGGTFPGGQVGLVGEEGPELIQTPPGGATITPAGETAAMLQQAAAAPPVVNVSPPAVSVVNVSDPSEVPSGIESAEGEAAVLNVIRRNRKSVKGTIG